jgi:carboxylesterase type B
MEEGSLCFDKAGRLFVLIVIRLYMGGASDRRYNLSFIVQNSVDIGKPIIGLSMAYRLSAWGFLDGQEVRDEGSTNVGLHDQR